MKLDLQEDLVTKALPALLVLLDLLARSVHLVNLDLKVPLERKVLLVLLAVPEIRDLLVSLVLLVPPGHLVYL